MSGNHAVTVNQQSQSFELYFLQIVIGAQLELCFANSEGGCTFHSQVIAVLVFCLSAVKLFIDFLDGFAIECPVWRGLNCIVFWQR